MFFVKASLKVIKDRGVKFKGGRLACKKCHDPILFATAKMRLFGANGDGTVFDSHGFIDLAYLFCSKCDGGEVYSWSIWPGGIAYENEVVLVDGNFGRHIPEVDPAKVLIGDFIGENLEGLKWRCRDLREVEDFDRGLKLFVTKYNTPKGRAELMRIGEEQEEHQRGLRILAEWQQRREEIGTALETPKKGKVTVVVQDECGCKRKIREVKI